MPKFNCYVTRTLIWEFRLDAADQQEAIDRSKVLASNLPPNDCSHEEVTVKEEHQEKMQPS